MSGRPGLLVQVALAALAGGLLAALLLAGMRTVDNKPALVLIVLAAVVFCVLAVASRPPAQHRASAPARPYPPAPGYGPAPTYPPDPAPVPRPAGFSWSQPPATGNGYATPSWSAPTAEAAPAPERSLPVAAAAVSVHDGRWLPIPASGATRVVQCPSCGEFAVEVGQRAPGFAFRCRCCGHEWRWTPGVSWPVSVVRPGAQHQQARSS